MQLQQVLVPLEYLQPDLLAAYDVCISLAKQIGDQALEAKQHKNKGIVLKSRAKACEGVERSETLRRALESYQSASEVQAEHAHCIRTVLVFVVAVALFACCKTDFVSN